MHRAGRYHLLRRPRSCWWRRSSVGRDCSLTGTFAADALLEALASAETPDVLGVIEQLGPSRRWADPQLCAMLNDSPPESKEHLHASLALLPIDSSQVDYLKQRLLTATPQDVWVLRDALGPYENPWRAELWRVVQNPTGEASPADAVRCQCAGACTIRPPVAGRLRRAVSRTHWCPSTPCTWGRGCRTSRRCEITCSAPLSDIYRNRDGKRSESQQSLATDILADYAADNPERLADLVDVRRSQPIRDPVPQTADAWSEGHRLIEGRTGSRVETRLAGSTARFSLVET